jgi:DNA helicase-2/ATP-dependent DNA helicase PcrA
MREVDSLPEWWGHAVAASGEVLSMPDGWEDMALPLDLVRRLPEKLRNAVIREGDVHPPTDSVRLNGPPGTGKTTQIALRLAVLIDVEGIDPAEMTVVTYRVDLADAVKRKLRAWGVVGDDTELEFFCTMHAAANRATGLLQRDPREAVRDGDLGNAMGYRERAFYCKKQDIQFYPPKNRPWEDTRGQLLLGLFDYMRNNLLDPTDEADVRQCPSYDDLREKWPGVDVQAEWEKYQDFKAQRGWHDFWELLEAALDGSSLPPTRVVVVDEYHDATPLMAAVAEKWFEHADTAIAAGDPLQVVNQYAGSHPRFFTERLDHLPEILLDRTYRVGEEHWQSATRMLQKEFTPPPVERTGRSEILTYNAPPIRPPEGRTSDWTTPSESTPGSPAWLYNEFIADTERSILYLARTRRWARGVSVAMDRAGIIHDGQRGPGGWGWDDHRLDVFNALKKLERVPATYGDAHHGRGLDEYATDAADAINLRFTADEFAELLDHANARTLTLSRDDAEDLAAEHRREERVATIRDVEEIATSEFWQQYTTGAASVKRLTKGDLTDHDLKALRRALPRYDDVVEDTHHVRVLTIHASKGAEATDVCCFDGITGKIAREMDRSEETRQNEARTWYVGLSRASERLHLMYDAFPGAIDHLPGNLAPQAAASARRQASEAMTDGGADDR